MLSLSVWAKQHPVKARIIIIVSHLLLALLAYFIGNSLRNFNISLSSSVLFGVSLLFICVALIYPHKADKPAGFNIRYTYWFRKCCDVIAIACSFCMLCCFANNDRLTPIYDLHATNNSTAPAKTSKPTAQEILSSLKSRDKKSLTRPEKRILRKEFKHQLKTYIAAKIKGDPSGAAQALLILLAIIVAVGLVFAIAALACSLSCSGSDALAALVLIVGVAGVIWLLVYVIKQITHPKKKEKTDVKDPAATTS